MKQHIKTLVAALLLTTLGSILLFAGHPHITPGPELSTRRLLGNARVFDPEGHPIDAFRLPGHIVALHFWASWCSYCMKELPQAAAMYSKLRPLGLEVIAVSLDEDRSAAVRALRARSIRWAQVDGTKASRRLADIYQVREIPHVILIGGGGRILWSGVPDSKLETRIAKELRAARK